MTHNSWGQLGDGHFPRQSGQIIRGTLSGYHKDKEGRVRWDLESRTGAAYSDVEILTPAGFMTSPKIGDDTECIIIDLNGDHSHLVAIPIGNADNHIRLEPGESALYSPENPGRFVKMKADGSIEIETDQPVKIKGQKIVIEGDVEITGDITQTGSITSTGTHAASAHV